MAKGERQKFKEGAIVKIELSENRVIFGRLLPGYKLGIYDYIIEKGKAYSVDEIISREIFLYVCIYRNIISKGIFEIIDFRTLQTGEIDKIPPQFMQDSTNLHDCIIFYQNGTEHKASPIECLELERSAVWDEDNLKQRIEDKYGGKRNFHRELQRVILSKDDVRYLNSNLRWDFEEEKFH